jgi:hypothetical protein
MQMQHETRESIFTDSEDVQWIKRLRRRSVCSSKVALSCASLLKPRLSAGVR